MKLTYHFTGIHTASDGSYPRARVAVTCNDTSIPPGLFYPTVDISLPLTTADLDATCQAIALQALDTARQLALEPALLAWLQQRAAPIQP